MARGVSIFVRRFSMNRCVRILGQWRLESIFWCERNSRASLVVEEPGVLALTSGKVQQATQQRRTDRAKAGRRVLFIPEIYNFFKDEILFVGDCPGSLRR